MTALRFRDILRPGILRGRLTDTEDTDMETYRLQQDAGPDIEFTGTKLAQVSSRSKPGQLRWTELILYRTAAGKLVCHELGLSDVAGEETRSQAYVADSGFDLVDQVGSGKLATDLYRQAGIDHVIRID